MVERKPAGKRLCGRPRKRRMEDLKKIGVQEWRASLEQKEVDSDW